MDPEVPNLRGNHGAAILAFVKPIAAVAIFVASLVWQAAQFASKNSIEQAREDIWNLRLEARSQKDGIVHLQESFNEFKAQLLQQAAASTAQSQRRTPR